MPAPKPDIENIKKFFVHRYVEKKDYRDIAEIMKKDLKTLVRWNRYIKQGILPDIKVGNFIHR